MVVLPPAAGTSSDDDVPAGAMVDASATAETSAWSPTLKAVWAPNDQDPPPLVPIFKNYYSQRQPAPQTGVTARAEGLDQAAATGSMTAPSRWTPFLTRMTKKTVKILPTPRANRLRPEALTPAPPSPHDAVAALLELQLKPRTTVFPEDKRKR